MVHILNSECVNLPVGHGKSKTNPLAPCRTRQMTVVVSTIYSLHFAQANMAGQRNEGANCQGQRTAEARLFANMGAA